MRAFFPLLVAFLALVGCSDITVIEQDDDDSTAAPIEGDEAGECSDGADNDQDGLFDCDDEGCVGSPECVCDDSDGDLVCDEDDLCPGADDALDTDGDGVVDCLDPCPQDALDDSDGDGVCDSDDQCPGGDDTIDADGDGQIDACARCLGSGGWTQPDNDGDGLPDDCLLRVLLEDGASYVTDNIEADLLARGWTVDYVASAALAQMSDFSAYDVVALTFPGSAQANVYAANALGLVGVLVHRGGTDFGSTDLGSSSFYQSVDCVVDDASHFVTQSFTLGPLNVDYTYKTIVQSPASGTHTLVSCADPSLVVHDTLRRLTTPYYGHEAGMPWSADAELLDRRSYAWVAGFGP